MGTCSEVNRPELKPAISTGPWSLSAMLFLVFSVLFSSGTAAFWLSEQELPKGPTSKTFQIDFAKASLREQSFSNKRSATSKGPVLDGEGSDSANHLVALAATWSLLQARIERLNLAITEPVFLKPRSPKGQPHSPRAPPSLS